MKKILRTLTLATGFLFSPLVFSQTATIAVASNFTKTIEVVGKAYEAESGHHIKFSFGPTGKLYAQIKNGAPFDAYFGADEKRPLKTIEDGMGIADSYFVYAQGQIVLYSSTLPVKANALEVLKDVKFKHLAIANPKTAPYGERAVAFLKAKGLYDGLESKLVNGDGIAHAFQYVVTKNAEIGFIALSQVVDPQSPVYQKGQYWIVPQNEYKPINQGAVMTKRGQNNVAVKGFMKFMKSPKAVEIIKSYGYNVR